MKYLTKEVKIGLAGIVAIALLVFGINFLKGINMFKSGNGYYVEFENIAGLVTSSPVYANGFGVGLVRDIHYDYNHQGKIVVEIDLNDDMKLPVGTTAELETEMLGTVKMNLMLPASSSGVHAVGDTISGSVNAGMMGAAANLVPKIESMIPKLDSILGSINNLLADQSLANTVHNAEQITADLQVTTRSLNALLQHDLPSIAGNLNTVTANFAVISTALKDIDYVNTIAKVNATLDGVKQFTESLQNPNGTIGLLLNDDSLYRNLTRTTDNAASLLEDLQAHPQRYVHFSIWGRKDN
ncbi:MAG: MCE family protein [Bacteroidaceae bacterium]|nr:MCE family protein [Bacteroidaceae bacterium]